MVDLAYEYRAYPERQEVEESAERQIDLHRQLYNHALVHHYRPAPEHNKPSYTTLQNELLEWKRRWPVWSETHSKALRMTVKRIYRAQDALDELEERGDDVGRLRRKAPREFRSVTYNQSGFDVDSNTGRELDDTRDYREGFEARIEDPEPEFRSE